MTATKLACNLETMGFILLKPDSVKQNLENDIWSFLEGQGLVLLAQKSVVITPEKRQALYKDFILSNRTNWDVGAGLYNLGNALALLCTGPFPSNFRSLSEYLSGELKGYFVPEEAAPITIRGRFNALNPVFNLLHTADNPLALDREASIFFSKNELDAITSEPVPLKLNHTKNLSKHPSTFSFTESLFKLKQELLNLEESSSATSVSKYRLFLNDALAELNNSEDRKKSKKALIRILTEEKLNFHSHQKGVKGPVQRMLNALTEFSVFKDLSFADLFRDLKDLGIRLDSWEEYLLMTSMYYFLFERANSPGER